MASHIFLTSEGYAFHPNLNSALADIENLQVIGFAEGNAQDDAFRNLLDECPYLAGTTFDEIFCCELSQDCERTRRDFSLEGPG